MKELFTHLLRPVFSVAWLRLRLLLRQKLGWLTLAIGAALVFLSLLTARMSFVNPLRIFWDFSLGLAFVTQVALALFLSSQLYNDEKNRRTLHLLLSGGLSRWQWLAGNVLGLWAGLVLMKEVWFLLSALTSVASFGLSPLWMQIEAQWGLTLEIGIILFFGVFLSLFTRPIIALAAGTALVLFCHSADDLQRIFTDPQVGRFVEDRGVGLVFWLSRLLPPLDWLDLKSLVGYESALPFSTMAAMSAVALLWILVLYIGAALRFERMDL